MADLQKYFERFHYDIRVNFDMNTTLQTKRDIILGRVRKHLEKIEKPTFREMLQGSYRMKTGTIPIADLEYDIDVGLRFSFREDEYDAATVRSWIFDAVDGHTEKVEDRGPCIRVTYADGFHVDLVIYANWIDDFGDEQFRLAHKENGWRPAEPFKLLDYVKERRRPFDGTEDSLSKNDQFRRVVRYQRRWIDEEIPIVSDAKPTGLAFVLLTAERLSPTTTWTGKPDDSEGLMRLAENAGGQIGRIVAHKPTPEYEDMFERLSDDDMTALKSRYRVMAETIATAREMNDDREACLLLRKIFGSDFPVPDPPTDEPKRTSGPAIVTSSSSG